MAIAADGRTLDGDGRVLDCRYRLERWVASGGFGEVWRATDEVLGRPVAVKLLRADLAADAEVLAQFRLEARQASSVTHENLARVFDYNDEVAEQPPFLVMEFVDSQPLADLLVSGPLTVPATLGIIAQVAAGMAAAHEAGLVHLDVKPANILLCGDGVVKLTDFGIGRAVGPGHTGEGIGWVTPAYLAPECVTGEKGTAAADLYSLGVIAHECLRGEPPFTGTPLQVAVAHRVRDLPGLPTATPIEVAALIMELTDKDPVNRPVSAAQVAKRASALREQVAPPTPARFAQLPASELPQAVHLPAVHLPAAGLPVRRPLSGRLLLVPVVAVVAVAAAFFLAGRLDGDRLSVQNEIRAGHATAQVNGAAFRNRPVSLAESRLRRMGFRVRIQWRRSARVAAGLVIAVSPTGRVPLGSVVTVFGSLSAGSSGQVTFSQPARNHHRKSGHAPQGGPTGKASHSPKASSPPSPQPTPTTTPSPTGTPSPTPSQSSSGSPTPTGSPSSTGNPSPSVSPPEGDGP